MIEPLDRSRRDSTGKERGPRRTPALCQRSAGRRGQRRAASVCGRGGTSKAACRCLGRTTAAAANSRRWCRWGRPGPAVGRTCEILPMPRFCARRRHRPVCALPTPRRRCSCRRGTSKRGADDGVPMGGHSARWRRRDTSGRFGASPTGRAALGRLGRSASLGRFPPLVGRGRRTGGRRRGQ